MLQAAEELVKEGYVPAHDVYFFSDRAEETSGCGADTVSKLFQERGIRLSMVLDEGGMILEEPIGGAKGTFAMVGLGEKSRTVHTSPTMWRISTLHWRVRRCCCLLSTAAI